MPIEVNGKELYSSSEVAQMFDISVSTVRTWRLNHRLEGTKIGTATYHTWEQIQSARTEPKTRGPKPKRKIEGDEGGNTSVRFLSFFKTPASHPALEEVIC